MAVDRKLFSKEVTARILAHPKIKVVRREVTDPFEPEGDAVIFATGPLTSPGLSRRLAEMFGGALSFYDAAAPIVSAESVDMESAFRASRYGRDEGSEGDYINCPLNKEEYEAFHAALVSAETAPLHRFDTEDGACDPRFYEGCMPIEVLAKRGVDSIRFGPMRPVGLRDPRTGHRPWAVLQLRSENADGKC